MRAHSKPWLNRILRAPAGLAMAGIAVYQTVLSPLKLFFFGAAGSCRFYPTCSAYARESLRRYGLVIGLGLAVWRLLKCHPFHPGGFDPVPENLSRRHCGCRETGSPARPESSRAPRGGGTAASSPGPSFLKHG